MPNKPHFRPKPPPRPMQSIFASLGAAWVLRILWACAGLVLLGVAIAILALGPPPAPEPIPRPHFEAWEVGLMFLAWFAISSFTFAAWQLAMHEAKALGKKPARVMWNAGLVLLNVLVILLVVDVFGLRLSGQDWSALGFKPLPPAWVAGSFALGLVSMVLSGTVAALVMQWVDPKCVNKQEDFILPTEQSTVPVEPAPDKGRLSAPGAAAMLLLVGVAIPIVEEMLFRGVLYAWMSEVMPWPAAVLLSTAVFGLAHFEAGRPVVAACVVSGLFLAVAFHYSHSLFAPIIIHAVNNLTKVALTYTLMES